MKKPLYPAGRALEMAKFKFQQERKPEPAVTDEILEKATNAACARFVGGISASQFRRRMSDLTKEYGFSSAEHLMGAISHTPGATWPFTDSIPADWKDAPVTEKPLSGGVVIR